MALFETLRSRCRWQPAFVLALVLVGLPYRWISYRQLDLPDALRGQGLVLLALAVRVWSGGGRLRCAWEPWCRRW
ncbi:MAG: hypothetical protein ACK52V_16270 [Betaproteobacteria bacterium]|jgi:hypothetical protein|nr:hypothetical protein [Betaproteobacteria bacterium]